MNRLEVAIKAVKQAGIIVKEGFENLSLAINTKNHDNDILTEYDLKSQEIIISYIKKYFSDDQIIGEEDGMGDKGQSTAWVIDPIDGTNPFSRKIADFGIIVGYMVEYKAQFCVMFNPVTDELYIAQKGLGATLNGNKIRIAHRPFQNQLVSLEGFGIKKQLYLRYLLQDFFYNVIGRSSSCASTMMVIKGQSDAYICECEHIWDRIHYLFLQEAGGKVTNFTGGEYTLDQTNYISCHPQYHGKYILALKETLPLSKQITL